MSFPGDSSLGSTCAKCHNHKYSRGTGELAQWLRALVLLQRAQVQFPASVRQLTTACNSSPRASVTFL